MAIVIKGAAKMRSCSSRGSVLEPPSFTTEDENVEDEDEDDWKTAPAVL